MDAVELGRRLVGKSADGSSNELDDLRVAEQKETQAVETVQQEMPSERL